MTDSNEHLQELHTALASDLLARIQSGEATAQELSVAVKFLKDNHIEAIATPDNELGKLMAHAPVFDDDGPATFN